MIKLEGQSEPNFRQTLKNGQWQVSILQSSKEIANGGLIALI